MKLKSPLNNYLTHTKKEKGITLIALVVTIIILLILAGVTLNFALSGNGLFNRSLSAKERYEKSQLQEEISVAIMDIQLEEMSKGKDVTLDSLVDGQLSNKLGDITAELGIPGIVGEYKDYNYTIDDNFNVEIGDKVDGAKPKIITEIITTGYVLEGNSIEIKVMASIAEGNVTLNVPEDMTLISTEKDENQEKIYKYTVTKNGNYSITAIGDGGKKTIKTLKIDKILDKPKISVTDNVGTEFTVNILNNYPEDDSITYTYYLNNTVKADKIKENKFQISGLEESKVYNVKVALNYGEKTLESEKIDITTISVSPQILIDGNFEITPLENPTLTKKGIFNCSMNIKNGENRIIKIPNSETLKKVKNIITYYSLDDGQSWKEYIGEITFNYNGYTPIKAKREINGKSYEAELILYKQYTFDSTKTCTNPWAMKIQTYDGNNETFADCDNSGNNDGRWKLDVDEECCNGKIGINFSSAYVSSAGNYMGCLGMERADGSLFYNGGDTYIVRLANNKDANHSNPAWEYVTIPEGCKRIGFSDGSSAYYKFYVYELKYVE